MSTSNLTLLMMKEVSFEPLRTSSLQISHNLTSTPTASGCCAFISSAPQYIYLTMSVNIDADLTYDHSLDSLYTLAFRKPIKEIETHPSPGSEPKFPQDPPCCNSVEEFPRYHAPIETTGDSVILPSLL